MAIALHTSGSGSSASFGTNVSAALTIGAITNGALFFFIARQQDTTEPDAFTWNGSSITPIKISPTTSPNSSGHYITAYVLPNPSAASSNLVVSSGQDEWNAGMIAVVLSGVDQTTPASDWNSATGTSQTPNVSISNVASGDWSMHISSTGEDGDQTWTQGASGETEVAEVRSGPAGDDSAVQYDNVNTGTVNLTHGLGVIVSWISGGFRVRQAAASDPALSVFLEEPIIGGSVFT